MYLLIHSGPTVDETFGWGFRAASPGFVVIIDGDGKPLDLSDQD